MEIFTVLVSWFIGLGTGFILDEVYRDMAFLVKLEVLPDSTVAVWPHVRMISDILIKYDVLCGNMIRLNLNSISLAPRLISLTRYEDISSSLYYKR